MASLVGDQPSLASQPELVSPDQQDPFSASSNSSHHRFSHFDNQLFALGPTASPDQAKRALEAHLAETERRIQEASRLGTTLVEQRKELAERLKDVEKQQSEGDITPELRQKLVEVEKEYNEVGRESARAFLPKSRVSSAEIAGGSPYRSVSPSKFESQATNSPSKLSVPNRKQRNQPSNRVHDIEFATEISTSLLSQVRHLQALLAEKEESLKTVTLEKSRLEIEAEGFNQRLRSLDESEHRYKDENWNLETQIHEYLAAAKDSADREKRLNQNLSILQAEKSAAQKELDEIKLSHAQLSEDHAAALKHHDVELGGVKRSMNMADNERNALQKRVEDLIGQNQELARAVAHQRGRLEDQQQSRGLSDDDFETAPDNATPEHSPPPSPTKGTPRHSMLESETLKSSLHHAHRMIQNLKSNIYREKTEKLELKRMLQDARDDLDSRRTEFGSGNGKRTRKVDSREFKKPLKLGQLGGLRNSRSEVFIEDANWEEDDGQRSPSQTAILAARAAVGANNVSRSANDSSDMFETANEQDSTDAFETANERGTETEDFQTGAEEMSDSDELTETEGPAGTARQRPPPPLALTKAGNRDSFQSTASTSGDEYSYEDVKTPTSQQPQRLRLRVSRGGGSHRRSSRAVSEEPSLQSSPASFANSSQNGTPQAASQSLFAELGDMSDEEDSTQGTPSRINFMSGSATPTSRPGTAKPILGETPVLLPSVAPVPKLAMVDSATMTEPWQPEPATHQAAIALVGAGLAGVALTEAAHLIAGKDSSTDARSSMSDSHTVLEPEPRRSMSDSHTSTEPEVVRTMSESHTLTELEPIPVISHNHTSTEAGPARVMSDSHTSTEPEPIRIMSDRHTSTEPESIRVMSDKHTATDTPVKAKMSDAAVHWHQEQLDDQSNNFLGVGADYRMRPVSDSTYSDMSSQYDPEIMEEKLAKFPSPPTSRAHTPMASLSSLEAMSATAPLTMSQIVSEHIEPTEAESPIVPSTPKGAPLSAPLAFSSLQFLDTEPISPRSPRPDGMIIPRDDLEEESVERARPQTPKNNFLGTVLGWNKGKVPATPIIAEDDTRQSPSDSPLVATPDSQRPFKEVSGNSHDRAVKKAPVETIDESSQTALTATQIDEMLHAKRQDTILAEDGNKSPSSPRVPLIYVSPRAKKSQDSIGSVPRARSKMTDPDFVHDTEILKRPGSAGSTRNNSTSSAHPPLPMDHKLVIAAAAQRSGSSSGGPGSMGPPPLPASAQRSNSSSGGTGSMGPPPLPASAQRSNPSSGGTGSMGPPSLPASAYKNPSFRPRTPSSQPPMNPISLRAGTTPRPIHSSAGTAEIHSPSRTARSRASSVSSFVSEIDTRFNMKAAGLPNGLDPGTDPRMINAITQTMIGEYLWKYTRKAGRGAMSENRHRRYFWVHPYTRTLYWSDRDPSAAGRAELKAKSVPIEAVRVVTDDNPMPPGLHRKSLIIMTPGRSVKFTASTGQRHETWFNALSYLLLRTGEDAIGDTESLANGALTQDDVDEFNPGNDTRSTRRVPASLSSYNSRTTPNDSLSRSTRIDEQPRLVSNTSTRPTLGSLSSRLSSYWKPGEPSKSFSSRRSRHSMSENGQIYEASEVHDSAEDLREQYEKQDRESDRLENVRACCDGKHDVGHLHNHSVKSRHASTISAASGSRPTSAQQQTKSRNSIMRRTD
ncbi:related to AMI1 protein [Rhynchosporium secalis]|uniref:Related to AMI1 protein n=1 Tax=Rhynchosporium secalis TaxID=38038 RepID=A0A1E1MGT7_RHYSE|nr:related to AMI1 protein [Rhynchosporium secalis]